VFARLPSINSAAILLPDAPYGATFGECGSARRLLSLSGHMKKTCRDLPMGRRCTKRATRQDAPPSPAIV
jgi:hypothetical protein